MSTASLETAVPAGTWELDALHSHAGFAVQHMVVSRFRSQFKELTATLTANADGSATLAGVVRVASIDVDDPNLKGHLLSGEFFAADAHPTITFTSDSLQRTGEAVVVSGDLTIKGVTHRVEGRGTIAEPTEDFANAIRLGVFVETVVDRTAFGLDWNAPLPKGGFALANEVKLSLELEFVKA